MMRAAQRRGHEAFVTEPDGLAWNGEVTARATRLSLADNDEDWYRPHETAERALGKFDAVLMRKDPPFDMEFVSSTWLLSEAERQGARVFNRPAAIRDHNEKFALAEFARFAAPSLVARDMDRLQQFIDAQKHVVLKRFDGMGGQGIF